MKLNLYHLSREKCLQPLSTAGLPAVWPKARLPQWLDVVEATSDELKQLLTPLNLHPLILEDCLDTNRSSLMNRYDRALYFEFPINEQEDYHARPYLSVLCLDNKLITIRRGSIVGLNVLAANLSGDIRLYAAHKEALLYQILDYFVDQNILLIIEARNQVDRLAHIFDEEPDSVEIEAIQALRRRIGRLVTVAEDHLYCVTALQTVETRAFSIGRQREYFRDLVSISEQAIRFTNRLEERLNELHEYYQLTLNNRFESRLRVLTILSAIILPLTLISSIYGMNFRYMPELQQPYGYFVVLGVMGLVAVGMLLFFYRRRWFE